MSCCQEEASEESYYRKVLLVCLAASVISSSSLLVKASQVDGAVLYSKFSVTLLSEFLKLTIAGISWLFASSSLLSSSSLPNYHESQEIDNRSGTSSFPTFRDIGLYSIPAILYLITNNMKYPILERVNPGVFAVVWNLKVVGIALLLRFVLRREITQRKWIGVFLLVLGSGLAESSQWNNNNSSSSGTPEMDATTATTTTNNNAARSTNVQGVILVSIALVIISVANVTCEYIYKRPTDSNVPIPLHKQNMVLYSWGLILNAIAWWYLEEPATSGDDSRHHNHFFENFTRWTVAVVIMNGVSGYLVGAMFKYMDAIAAIFADLIAMLAVAVTSAIVFELDANFVFCLGFSISSLSIWVYYGDQGAAETIEAAEMVALNPDLRTKSNNDLDSPER